MLAFDEVAEYCLSLPGAVLEFPFDADTPVFKAGGKMFCLVGSRDVPLRINLKCDPDLARSLRDSYPAVTPGWHMNKTHWNSVCLNGSLDDGQIRQMISHSHGLVYRPFKKVLHPVC